MSLYPHSKDDSPHELPNLHVMELALSDGAQPRVCNSDGTAKGRRSE
jgi:hypothetical protein